MEEVGLLVENENISVGFLKECDRESLSEGRKRKYVNLFKKLNELGIDLKQPNREDIDKFFFYLKDSNYADLTKDTYWKMFKKICRWIDPTLIFKFYKIKIQEKVIEVLTEEEISGMIEKCTDIKHRLLIMLLAESGARIGEIMNLKKADIRFDKDGAILIVNGKTGVRNIRLVRFAKQLFGYLQFLNEDNKLFDVSHRTINKIIKETARKAGIQRRVYPQLFRHTRATALSKLLPEPAMRLFFGWSKDSDMPKIYVHLSGRDVDSLILEINKLEVGTN